MNVTSNKRLLALDVMRGITIAGMILVNNPGHVQYPRCPENYQKNDCHFPYRDSHQLVCLALLLSRPASLCPNPGSGSDATACPLLRSIRINCLAY